MLPKVIKKISYTPENVGGGCMTGKIATKAEVKEISSYLAQYKASRKVNHRKMIKNAAKIDYDIKSVPLNREESERLTKVIADYKKKKAAKKAKKRHSSSKRIPA